MADSSPEHDLIRPGISKERGEKKKKWPRDEGFKVISVQGSFPFPLKSPGDPPKAAWFSASFKGSFVLLRMDEVKSGQIWPVASAAS